MASSTGGSPQSKPRTVTKAFVIIILVVLIAAVIGTFFLPQPYFAIGQVVIYAWLLVAIAGKLRACLRLARGSEYLPKVQMVVLWLVVGVLSVVAHLGNLFRTEDRDYITLATNLAVYLALISALELVEVLLKRSTAGTGSSAAPTNAAGDNRAEHQHGLNGQ